MINHLVNETNNLLTKIQEKTGVSKIQIDKKIHLTDLRGKVITISDKSEARKERAVDLILAEYENFQKDTLNFNPSRSSLIILIPEAFVSLFIGYKGGQIKRMMSLYNTKIVVNQPIQNISFRSVEISGNFQDICRTCKECISSLQTLVRDKNIRHLNIKPRPTSLKFSQTMAKLVVHARTVDFLDGLQHNSLGQLEQEFEVKINVYSNFKLPFLKPYEKVLQIEGSLLKTQQALSKVIKNINDYADESMSFNFERMFLIIPSIFITKLIGAGGCMIRELAAKSGGAQIKILSNREKERDHRIRECVMSIAGSLVNKQDAACLVLEQIESFKNGGPVLMSGRVLGKNIAMQFKHSLQGKDSYNVMIRKRSGMEEREVVGRIGFRGIQGGEVVIRR